MRDEIKTIRDLIQEDIGKRGLATVPGNNLLTACANDLAEACHSLATTPQAAVAIVTGFFIPHAQPPSGETDGPLGALFLARALVPLGMRVVLASDAFCTAALEAGLALSGLRKEVPLITLPAPEQAGQMASGAYQRWFDERTGRLTHLIALERVGPSHTVASLDIQTFAGDRSAIRDHFLNDVPAEHQDRCHTMGGRDITAMMSPAHHLFANRAAPGLVTIGIGDGGNEIGMGKIPWEVIRRNIPRGGLVACRVPTDYLIVSGISNWGAYGLAGGVYLERGQKPNVDLFCPDEERQRLEVMVERGPLVDGLSGLPTVSVDGLDFARYAEVLPKLADVLATALAKRA